MTKSPTASVTISRSASLQTGIIVPLYTYPTDQSWTQIVDSRSTEPIVPIIAIINPNSGPGTSLDPNYVSGINRLKGAGCTVLGYTYSQYAARALSAVEADITAYKTWYPALDGIFVDQMSGNASFASYYQSLQSFITGKGFTASMGNPGTSVASALFGVFDELMIYESGPMPGTNTLAAYTAGHPRTEFCYVANSVAALPSQAAIQATTQYVLQLFICQNNSYSGLPSYWTELVSVLGVLNG